MKFKLLNKKTLFITIICITIAWALVIYVCNKIVTNASESFLYNSAKDVPPTKVALLLGTSKYLTNGHLNNYFSNRIVAAVELYKAGAIQNIIVSGDNSRADYDEPTNMRMGLIKNGVDSTKIFLDYAGFRTFDSVVRLKEIFGQDKAIVISQKFHNERAIYIAQKLGIQLYGYNAKDVNKYYGFKTNIRELLARVKVIVDFTFGIKPKFLGEKVVIE